jgi:hypothetical protein
MIYKSVKVIALDKNIVTSATKCIIH